MSLSINSLFECTHEHICIHICKVIKDRLYGKALKLKLQGLCLI
jgi:hypothetical protein